MNVIEQMELLNKKKEFIGRNIYTTEADLPRKSVTIREDKINNLSLFSESGDIFINTHKYKAFDSFKLSNCCFSLQESIAELKKYARIIAREFPLSNKTNEPLISNRAKEAKVGDYIFYYSQEPFRIMLDKITEVTTDGIGCPVVVTENQSCSMEYYLDNFLGYNELCRIDDKTGILSKVEPTILWANPKLVSEGLDSVEIIDTFSNNNHDKLLTVVKDGKSLSLSRNYDGILVITDEEDTVVSSNFEFSYFPTVDDLITYIENQF